MSKNEARVTEISAAHRPDSEPLAALGELIAAFSVLRVQNSKVISALAASHGVGSSDLRAVSYLAATGGATPKRVAEHLGLSTGAMTTLADRLQAAGFVRRAPHPSDRRSLVLSATKQGLAVMNEVNELYIEAFASALGPDEDPERVRGIFLALADALGTIAEQRGAAAAVAE